MPSISLARAGHPNILAFLDMLAFSEIGERLLSKSDNGYNVIVGGSLFTGYADHPRKLVDLPRLGIKSTAAGRYQILKKNFDAYKKLLNLPDFGKESQDLIALQLIRERKAIDLIKQGKIEEAIGRVRNIWASLPGAGYGQHEHNLADLLKAYTRAGGSLS